MVNLLKLAASASVVFSSLVHAAPTVSEVITAETSGNSTVHQMMARGGCASDHGGVHIIAARGSTEPPGMGSLGQVAALLQPHFPHSTAAGVDYPAILGEQYGWSVTTGTLNLAKEIERHVAKCPRSRIILMGYSQGAQVVMNNLCGTDEGSWFGYQPRLPQKLWKHIAAVLIYADPTHLAGQPYDAGTANANGMFPRLDPTKCTPFAKRIRAYCDWNDPVCAGGTDGAVHTSYFSIYNSQAAEFLRHKARHHMPWRRHHGRHH